MPTLWTNLLDLIVLLTVAMVLGVIAERLKDVAQAYTSVGRYDEAIAGHEAHRAHLEQLMESGLATDAQARSELRFERAKSFGSLARTIQLSSSVAPMLEPATRAAIAEIGSRAEVWVV